MPKKNDKDSAEEFVIQYLINNKNKFIGHFFAGKYLDCGSMKGYVRSSIEMSKLNL